MCIVYLGNAPNKVKKNYISEIRAAIVERFWSRFKYPHNIFLNDNDLS